MEQVCSSENSVCVEVMSENEDSIMRGMMSSLGSCAASARKPRLQLLEIMLPKMETEQIKLLVGELVLCTKDTF